MPNLINSLIVGDRVIMLKARGPRDRLGSDRGAVRPRRRRCTSRNSLTVHVAPGGARCNRVHFVQLPDVLDAGVLIILVVPERSELALIDFEPRIIITHSELRSSCCCRRPVNAGQCYVKLIALISKVLQMAAPNLARHRDFYSESGASRIAIAQGRILSSYLDPFRYEHFNWLSREDFIRQCRCERLAGPSPACCRHIHVSPG